MWNTSITVDRWIPNGYIWGNGGISLFYGGLKWCLWGETVFITAPWTPDIQKRTIDCILRNEFFRAILPGGIHQLQALPETCVCVALEHPLFSKLSLGLPGASSEIISVQLKRFPQILPHQQFCDTLRSIEHLATRNCVVFPRAISIEPHPIKLTF